MSDSKGQITLKQIVTYSSNATERETNNAGDRLVHGAAEIIKRFEAGDHAEYVVVEPDLPAAGGFYSSILAAVKEAGYEVVETGSNF